MKMDVMWWHLVFDTDNKSKNILLVLQFFDIIQSDIEMY